MVKLKGLELLNACYFGNEHLAIRLLREGAQPDWMDPRDGWTGIHYAARWGLISVLNQLLKSGVDVNMRSSEKETPLHKACRSKKLKTCIWLMKNGADPTLRNMEGLTASEITVEEDLKYVCDNYEEYCKKKKDQSNGKTVS